MIGAMTIVGDVVSPRERARYMGLFMAMFGVTSVIGPLIGGFFVEYLSWRWIFYINIPIGAVALVVTATALPGQLSRVHRVIDYLGTALIALSATSLVLFTSLGGTTYPWTSPFIIGLAAAGVVFAILFLLAERRAVEPIIPLPLFTNKVFAAASAIGFVVGFAMFGALTFLPLFFQEVKGVSAIQSGVRLFPLMGGLLVASIGSGLLVSRWGRYKVFPVIGTGLMTVGLYLMSLIGVSTGAWVMAAYMVVFGLGLGFILQVLTVAVQNAVQLRGAGHGHLGCDLLPHDRRVIRHGRIRGHLRQSGVDERPTRPAPHQSAARLQPQLREPVGHPGPAAGDTERSDRGDRPHRSDHVPHRCPDRLRRLPLELDPAGDRVAQVHPHLRAGRTSRPSRTADITG